MGTKAKAKGEEAMNWDTISRTALLEEFSRKCCGECCICVERDNESGECGLIKWFPPMEAMKEGNKNE